MADVLYADARERYRLDSRIASGGMGEVWRATDTVLDRPVAVKLLKPEHAEDAIFRTRFETEAQHAAGLHHPGVAQVFDFGAGEDHHAPYLVMEHVDGSPLSAVLRPGQPMDPDAAARLLAAAGDALGAAHAQGIVHRDVKPANILVTADRQVKITDFGIARAADSAALTRTGEVIGTPQYLSPEQAEGRPATPASDVYSLGAVGYECLVGQRPFQADSPVATALAHLRQPVPDLPSTVPPALAGVVRRAMAKAPEERYADGAAFAAAVREAVTDPATTKVLPAPAAGAVPSEASGDGTRGGGSWGSRARRVPVPLWAAAAVLVLVVTIAALAGAMTDGGQAPPSNRTTPHTPAASAAPTSPPTRSPIHSAATTKPAPPHPKPKPPKHGPGHEHGHEQGHEHGKGHQ